MTEGKWIRFELAFDYGKTKRWQVFSKQNGDMIGVVYWYGGWRRYVFGPMNGTLFEQDCLRDIATFLEEKSREHFEAKASASAK